MGKKMLRSDELCWHFTVETNGAPITANNGDRDREKFITFNTLNCLPVNSLICSFFYRTCTEGEE